MNAVCHKLKPAGVVNLSVYGRDSGGSNLLDQNSRALLRDCRLVADGLPVSVAANPDACVAIRSAEIFAELVAFHVGAGRDHRSISVESNHHVSDVHRLVAELPAAAGRDGFLFRSDLAERGNGDIVLGERAQAEFGIAMQTGLLGLALHVDDLADDFL